MVNKILVFLSILLLTQSGSLSTCFSDLQTSYKQFLSAIFKADTNKSIDQIADILNEVPKILEDCDQNSAADTYRREVPHICITELDKAAKLVVKMISETDQFKMQKDFIFLETLYETKIRRHCPFIKDINFKNVQSGGVCMQASYQLSLVFQKMVDDWKAGNKPAFYNDLDELITKLPDTLEACGQSHMADEVRKYLPMNCVHALQNFGKELIDLEGNFMHWQWVFKHYKEILQTAEAVRKQCPYFHE